MRILFLAFSSVAVRKLLMLAALLVASVPLTASAASPSCLPEKPDELLWHKVQYVTRGDRLIVNNRPLQLEGLVAPFPGQKQKWYQREPEPLARQARLFVLQLLQRHGMQIGIEHDRRKYDRFLRERGHLYYRDADGRLHSLQQALLRAGLAMVATIPPNLKHQRCYYAAEQTARQQKRGIWRIAEQYPDLKFPLIPSDRIAGDDRGYRIIRGPVRTLVSLGDYEGFNLDTTGIRIPKEDFRRYWKPGMLRQLKGKMIEVRGRPYYARGHMYMTIQHPWQIDLLNPVYAAKIDAE